MMNSQETITSVNPKVFEQVRKVFAELHSRYRPLVSTWLLATFAAIEFVISTKNLIVPFDNLLLLLTAWCREGLKLDWDYP
jgi:hypothetical protein